MDPKETQNLEPYRCKEANSFAPTASDSHRLLSFPVAAERPKREANCQLNQARIWLCSAVANGPRQHKCTQASQFTG